MLPTHQTRKRGRSHALAVSNRWRTPFLAVLRDTANVRAACKVAGIARSTAYLHRSRFPNFAEQWADALADAVDTLLGRAFTIALDATNPGSATMLIYLLRQYRPERYRDALKQIVTVGGESLGTIVRLLAGPNVSITPMENDTTATLAQTAQ